VQTLNLPDYNSYLNFDETKGVIFDPLRKKMVALTPEEWVRQNFLKHMILSLKYPEGLIAVEKNLVVNQMKKRCDILVYDKLTNPVLLVECKAPQVQITQKTFDQIAVYNLKLNVKYLIVTNGLNHYCCQFEAKNLSYIFLETFPTADLVAVQNT
jgi:hypothetical protein